MSKAMSQGRGSAHQVVFEVYITYRKIAMASKIPEKLQLSCRSTALGLAYLACKTASSV